MNLSKVEKATIATPLAIFEDQVSDSENEVSKSNPFHVLITLVIIKGLIQKLDLEEIWNELHENEK